MEVAVLNAVAHVIPKGRHVFAVVQGPHVLQDHGAIHLRRETLTVSARPDRRGVERLGGSPYVVMFEELIHVLLELPLRHIVVVQVLPLHQVGEVCVQHHLLGFAEKLILNRNVTINQPGPRTLAHTWKPSQRF